MKTKSLPAIIMLVAGFIDCIFAILQHQSLMEFTRQLLLVLVIFYILGCAVQLVLDINFKPMEEIDGQEETGDDAGADATAEDGQQEDGLETVSADLEDIQSDEQ
jgi:hypothetical protein